MTSKLYQVTIGEYYQTELAPATEGHPAQTEERYNPAAKTMTVVAIDVPDAIAKIGQLPQGQHFASVEKVRDIDVA